MALRKPAPNIIPLSGEDRLRKRDYSSIRLKLNSDSSTFLALQATPFGVTGLWFNGEDSNGLEVSFSYRQTAEMSFSLEQYFRRYQLQYLGPLDFIFCQLTFKKYRVWFGDRVGQFFFNRKTLTRTSRLRLLGEIAEKSLEQANYSTGDFSYLREHFGDRYINHPDAARERRYIQFMLKSLADAGDLEYRDSSYRITGRGFSTLSIAEQEDRRHNDSVNLQRGLAFLTFCLVVVGLMSVDWLFHFE